MLDYTACATHYQSCVDYCEAAIKASLEKTGLKSFDKVVDMGAGTGRLTLPLAGVGLQVEAVEPNAAMRAIGSANTLGMPVAWNDSTAEETGLPGGAFQAVFFGDSFHEVAGELALNEAARLLSPDGWFCCIANCRDSEDSLHSEVEALICSELPNYRPERVVCDPAAALQSSAHFTTPIHFEEGFLQLMEKDAYIESWRSQAGLLQAANGRFDAIIAAIEELLEDEEELELAYTTRIWLSQQA